MKSRKWLAIVLVLAMCISMFPAAAYAEEEEPALQEEIQNEEMPVPEDNTPEQVETVEEDVPPEEPEADPEPKFENIVEGSPDGISPVLPLENGDDPEEQLSAAEETITDTSAPEMTLIQEAEAAEETDETTVETSDILAYPILSMNVETSAVVSAGGAEAYFRFVPTETKTYRFCSASESDTFGILYDAEMNEIDTDDNGGEEENFCVVSELFSGITYVFGARYVNPDETGTFLVTLADVSAENTAEESASETDTPEQGFSDFTTEVKQSAMLNGTSGFSAAADGDDHFTVLYDNNVTMKVIATPGYSESTLHFEWYNPAGEHIFDDDETCSPWVSSGGTFSCIVWEELNGERVNETTVEFVVSIKNNFSAFPVVDGYPDENESLNFYAITVPFNAVVTLEADAHSDIGVNYEWCDDESIVLEGETESKYTTPPITKYREFRCCASDDDSNSAYLYFDIYVDNSFSAEAENSNPQVSLGECATLRVTASAASGSETLQYEWYDAYGNPIEDATDESYQTEPVMSQQSYHCQVTDPYGNTREVYFTVSVDNEFSAEAENSNPQVALGERATLRVTASAASGSETLRYKWYDADWNPIEGETKASYQTEPVMSQQSYYCRVTDPYDNTEYVYFTVYIDNEFSAQAENSNPQVALGERATLRVIASAASGPETLRYKWYDENWNPIEGETVESYQTEPVMSPQGYNCEVTDPYGNTINVYFYVSVDNSFSAEAEDGTIQVSPGESAALRVIASAASGSETLQYEWYDNDWNQIEGATTESYQTEPVMSQQWYYCRVTDPYGDTRDVSFYVTVDNEFRADYASGDGGFLRVPIGEQAELKVKAFAKTGDLHYQWFGENGKIEGATADTFLTPAITSYQEFQCAISDDYGNGTWLYFHVQVDNGFSVRAVGETERYVAPGAKTTLEVTATANQGDFEYHWYDDYEEIPGATGRSFETPAIDYCKHYFCIVTDIYMNSIRIDFYINVENGFSVKAIDRFGQESRNVTVYVPMNGQTTLEVIATCSTGELTYQWYGNNQGSDVSGNHTPTLEIREVNSSQYYSCHVEDEFGNSGEVSFEVYVENGFSAYVKGTSKNSKEVFVEPGSDYTCEVDAWADEGEISYSWNWGADGEWQSQEGTSSLTLQNIQRFTNAWCLVEDMFGNYKDISFYISIQNHLSIYANNENSEFARVMVPLHGNAELSVRVEADNTENLKYEWYKTSKTEDYYDRTLVASGVDRYLAENMTGCTEYSCVVTDRYGNQAIASFEVFGSDLKLSPNSLTLAVGQTRAISAAGNGALPIVWRSSDEEIAIVDNNGAVTGKKVGFATITATAGESLTDCQVFVQFSDVTNPNDFFYEPIYQMVSYGVIGGWADGTFHPFDPCNRAAVVTFLWRLAGRPEPTSMAAFTDMPGDNIDFQKAISWAAENGITTGFVDGTFRPWDNCNRAAIVTFLWRYAGRPEPSGMAAFTDMPGDNIDFQKAISWAAENGITTGWDDGTFRPWNDCARLAVASFLNRYEKLL